MYQYPERRPAAPVSTSPFAQRVLSLVRAGVQGNMDLKRRVAAVDAAFLQSLLASTPQGFMLKHAESGICCAVKVRSVKALQELAVVEYAHNDGYMDGMVTEVPLARLHVYSQSLHGKPVGSLPAQYWPPTVSSQLMMHLSEIEFRLPAFLGDSPSSRPHTSAYMGVASSGASFPGMGAQRGSTTQRITQRVSFDQDSESDEEDVHASSVVHAGMCMNHLRISDAHEARDDAHDARHDAHASHSQLTRTEEDCWNDYHQRMEAHAAEYEDALHDLAEDLLDTRAAALDAELAESGERLFPSEYWHHVAGDLDRDLLLAQSDERHAREDVHDNLSDHSSHANADDNSETWSEREEEQGQQCAVEEDSSEELEDDEDMYQRLLESDTDD